MPEDLIVNKFEEPQTLSLDHVIIEMNFRKDALMGSGLPSGSSLCVVETQTIDESHTDD